MRPSQPVVYAPATAAEASDDPGSPSGPTEDEVERPRGHGRRGLPAHAAALRLGGAARGHDGGHPNS